MLKLNSMISIKLEVRICSYEMIFWIICILSIYTRVQDEQFVILWKELLAHLHFFNLFRWTESWRLFTQATNSFGHGPSISWP